MINVKTVLIEVAFYGTVKKEKLMNLFIEITYIYD